MFLRRTERKKNGKAHSYWNVVENKRLDDGRVVQRHVLYLGEINSSQAAAWRKAIEVFDEDAGRARTLALFPEDRCEAVAGDASVVQLRLFTLPTSFVVSCHVPVRSVSSWICSTMRLMLFFDGRYPRRAWPVLAEYIRPNV